MALKHYFQLPPWVCSRPWKADLQHLIMHVWATASLLAKGKLRVPVEVPETWNVSVTLKNANDLQFRVHSCFVVRAQIHGRELWGLIREIEVV